MTIGQVYDFLNNLLYKIIYCIFIYSETITFYHQQDNALVKSTKSGIGSFDFSNVKYLHPGRSHFDLNQGIQCQCLIDNVQFYANQVLDDDQVKIAFDLEENFPIAN